VRRGLGRTLLQAALILRQHGVQVSLVAGLVAAAATSAIFYPSIMDVILTLYPLFHAVGAVLPSATGLVEEAVSGRSQLYLATGLSRRAYAAAWLLALAAYPSIAVALGFLLPPLLLGEPGLLQGQPQPGPPRPSYPVVTALAVVTAAQIGSLAALAAAARSRGAVTAAVLASAVLIPIFAPIVAVLTLPPMHAEKAAALTIAVFNAYYAALIGGAMFKIDVWGTLIPLAAVAAAAYAAAAWLAHAWREY